MKDGPVPASTPRLWRKMLRDAVVLCVIALVIYWLVAVAVPIGWIATLITFPEFLWDRLPHVPGLSQAVKAGPEAIKRTEAETAQLREREAAINAALRQAADARAQAETLKRQLADAQAALAPLRAKTSQLDGDVAKHAARIQELEDALAKVRAAPLAPVRTRQEAVDAFRRMGY